MSDGGVYGVTSRAYCVDGSVYRVDSRVGLSHCAVDSGQQIIV